MYSNDGLCFGVSHIEHKENGTHEFIFHFDDDESSENQNIPSQWNTVYDNHTSTEVE